MVKGKAEGAWRRGAPGLQWSRKHSWKNPNEGERPVGKSKGVSSNKNGARGGLWSKPEKEATVTSLGLYLPFEASGLDVKVLHFKKIPLQ